MELLRSYLRKLGLSDKESAAYLYVQARGPVAVSMIAKDCALTRTHAYDIVRQLEEIGLCHSLGSEYGKRIEALPVGQLGEILERKEEEIRDMKNDLSSVSASLEALKIFRPAQRSQVAYYAGAANVRKLLNKTLLAESGLVRHAGSEVDLIKTLGEECLVRYHERRRDKGISLRALRPGIKRSSHPVFQDDKAYRRELRLRPEGELRLKSNIFIWDESLAIVSLGDEIFGTVINNAELALMMASWFDFLWEKSKKI